MTYEELIGIVDNILTNHKKANITTRELLEAHNAYRRTSGNMNILRDFLKKYNLQTIPDFNETWLDSPMILQEIPTKTTTPKRKLTPEERIERINRLSMIIKERLVDEKDITTDLSVFDNIADAIKDLPSLLNEDIPNKMKSILASRLGALENGINMIDSIIRKNKIINGTKAKNIIKFIKNINESLEACLFTKNTFKTLGFLRDNIVAIGANGSGKTSLAESIKRYVKTNCVVIGAQKLLLVPKLNSVLDIESSKKQLREQQAKDKALKKPLVIDQDEDSIADDVADEFSAVINNLLATHNSEIHKFANDFIKDSNTPREKTILERVFDLWHQIMPQRTLSCSDGINIMVHPDSGAAYPAYQLSDGEKVTLYLIADVMQTPNNYYIVVDEPETYLHKSIVNKLWDLLENEKKKDNCTFIYLTHNVEFAESRHAKKIWIKSYNPNTTVDLSWDIQEIPENDEIPQDLLFEILGSRHPILFCEGVDKKDSYSDAQIYEILYPQFTIKPAGSCKSVIDYTRAFNSIPGRTCQAYGIIDADFRNDEQKKSLIKDGIFPMEVSEIENLFLCEDFIRGLAMRIDSDSNCFEELENGVKKKFNSDMDMQVANYVSAKIDFVFKEENFPRGKDEVTISSHFADFCSKIEISKWSSERKSFLQSIKDNYLEIIKVYNNKGLKQEANKALKISDFSERAYRYLREDTDAKTYIKKLLPSQLSSMK